MRQAVGEFPETGKLRKYWLYPSLHPLFSFISLPFCAILTTFPSALLRACVCGNIKARTKTMFPRTFIITFHSTQVQPQFLNTVENWFLNPLTAHEICAVKILKELLLGLSGGKI